VKKKTFQKFYFDHSRIYSIKNKYINDEGLK